MTGNNQLLSRMIEFAFKLVENIVGNTRKSCLEQEQQSSKTQDLCCVKKKGLTLNQKTKLKKKGLNLYQTTKL